MDPVCFDNYIILISNSKSIFERSWLKYMSVQMIAVKIFIGKLEK